jgi:hypothetical protein
MDDVNELKTIQESMIFPVYSILISTVASNVFFTETKDHLSFKMNSIQTFPEKLKVFHRLHGNVTCCLNILLCSLRCVFR